METLILSIMFILAIAGMVIGKLNEKKHYHSIVEREAKYQHILLFNEKRPPNHLAQQPFHLVDGSVVMASDYFKQIVAILRSILGGRINSYESMLDRARREAILRMKEKAAAKGATMIFNVHLHTTRLKDQNTRQNSLICMEVLAYGTAWKEAEH